MVRSIAAAFFFLLLTSSTWAQTASRSYVFNGVVSPKDCSFLPQKSFEIAPSLSRSQSNDRLYVKCAALADGNTLLTLTFLLTDTVPALMRGEQRHYSFRWGARVGDNNSLIGEFTHDEQKCTSILKFLVDHASAKDPNIGPQWTGGCYGEDHWGTVMEITLSEATR